MDNMQQPWIMPVGKIEHELTLRGLPVEQLAEWSDSEARRIGELLIEWSKR